MTHSTSLEKTIYSHLAARIQSGFYSDGRRFPSVQEIARQFGVSYCPAQRALKALEKDGLIRVARGKPTLVIGNIRENYLESDTFRQRRAALADLGESLKLLSPAIAFQGMCHMAASGETFDWASEKSGRIRQWSGIYNLFENAYLAMGSQTVASLYYDINAFIHSAFTDLFHAGKGETGEARFLNHLAGEFAACFQLCTTGDRAAARNRLEELGILFFAEFARLLDETDPGKTPLPEQSFSWTPRKGRTRHCDMIALDLVCKINEGIYPPGTLLPGGTVLADIYHVSAITIRRTVGLLNRLGVTRPVNGVGTRVVSGGDPKAARQLNALLPGNPLLTFLETFQLLTVASEPVLCHAFPRFGPEIRHSLREALSNPEQGAALTATLSACLRGIVLYSPLAAIRDIYSKLTLLLLNGGILRFSRIDLEIGWPVLSEKLADALASGDGGHFSRIFRQLLAVLFSSLKNHLEKTGLPGTGEVVTPVFPD